MLKYLLSAGVILSLSACHTSPPTHPQPWQAQRPFADFNADGRLAVKINDKGSYANFDWQYQNGVQTIDINTPLGNTLGQLCQDSLGVLAVNNQGEQFTASSVSELSEQLLGYTLPLQYLSVWAHGQWVKDLPHTLLPDGSLQQQEWTITRTTHPDGTPRILELNSSKLSLRLVFNTLQPLANSPTSATTCAARNTTS